MKKFIFLSLLFACFIVSACTSENNEDSQGLNEENEGSNIAGASENLIDEGEITEEQWIDGNGTAQDNQEMINTGPIAYNSNENYWLNGTAYISYYNDDSFLETILYDYKNEFPLEIESIEEADNIFLSFNKKNADRIELSKE